MELKVANAVACSHCALYQTAKVLGLETPDCSSLDRLVLRDHPVAKNQFLYREGDAFRYLYLIHSGSSISTASVFGRNSQVTGFCLPGELAGMENIGQKTCNHSTQVLEQGSVCQLDYLALEETLSRDELIHVQSYLLNAAAFHARQLQWQRALTGLQTAEQRIAAFLINLSNRLEAHGFPSKQFRLPMSRDAIADYLGLATETVIRTLKHLNKQQIINIRAKNVDLMNHDALNALLTQ